MEAPQNFEQLRSRLAAASPQLPRRLRQAADYVVQHPDEVALGTAASVSKHAEVQASTLVRFAQAMGFAGFTELQGVFRLHLRNRLPDYPERLRALRAETETSDGSRKLLGGFCDAAIDSLRSLRDCAPQADLDRAIDKLAKAQTVYLVGQRRSFGVVHHLAYVLAKMQVRVALIDNIGGLGPEQGVAIGAKDALMAVSFSPYAALSVETTAAARAAGAATIVITDSPLSPLAAAADVRFDVAEKDFAAFRSQAATMCLAMTLAVGLAERRAAMDAHAKRRP